MTEQNSVVEQVARALCVWEEFNPDSLTGRDIQGTYMWETYTDMAEAATAAHIKALMEPTEQMLFKAWKAQSRIRPAIPDCSATYNKLTWQAMLTASQDKEDV